MDIKTASATAAATDALSFQGLNKLQATAQANPGDPRTIKAVAKQFEALFLQRMIETMQETKLGPDMLGDTAGPMFQSMFAQQLATTVTQGRGVGLADFIARELGQRFGAAAQPGSATTHPTQAPTPSPAPPVSTPTQHLAAPSRHATPLSAADAAMHAVMTPTPRTPLLEDADSSGSQGASGDAIAQRARSFFAGIMPSVRAAAAQLQVSPLAILAQAALETGWGSHAPGNNLFGIKAGSDWSGARVSRLTHEVRDGVSTLSRAAFRAYQNASDSVQNYAQLLLSSPRYEAVHGKGADIAGYAQALQHGGYATDPHYASKLMAIAHGETMRQVLAGLDLAAAPAQTDSGSPVAMSASSLSPR